MPSEGKWKEMTLLGALVEGQVVGTVIQVLPLMLAFHMGVLGFKSCSISNIHIWHIHIFGALGTLFPHHPPLHVGGQVGALGYSPVQPAQQRLLGDRWNIVCVCVSFCLLNKYKNTFKNSFLGGKCGWQRTLKLVSIAYQPVLCLLVHDVCDTHVCLLICGSHSCIQW